MLSVLPTDTHQCTVDATVHIFIKKDMKNSSPIIFFISTKKMFGNVRLISTAVDENINTYKQLTVTKLLVSSFQCVLESV